MSCSLQLVLLQQYGELRTLKSNPATKQSEKRTNKGDLQVAHRS